MGSQHGDRRARYSIVSEAEHAGSLFICLRQRHHPGWAEKLTAFEIAASSARLATAQRLSPSGFRAPITTVYAPLCEHI